MKNEILDALKKRDDAFLKQFCSEGSYLGDNGNIINGVCRQVDASEILNFMHLHDANVLEATKSENEK